MNVVFKLNNLEEENSAFWKLTPIYLVAFLLTYLLNAAEINSIYLFSAFSSTKFVSEKL